VVRVAAERLGYDLLELGFHVVDRLARREARAVADAIDVRVHGERLLAERRVEDDVGGLATDASERLELLPGARDLAAVVRDQRLAKRNDVLRLGVEQADGLDRIAQPVLAEVDHLLRLFYALEQRPRRDVDARVGRLGREDDGDEQLVWIGGFQLGGGRGVCLGKPLEELKNLVALHREPTTSRIE